MKTKARGLVSAMLAAGALAGCGFDEVAPGGVPAMEPGQAAGNAAPVNRLDLDCSTARDLALPLAPAVLARAAGTPLSLATLGSDVYWSAVDAQGRAAIWRSVDGGPAERLVSNLGQPMGLHVDADAMYWADVHTDVVMKAAHDGSWLEVLAQHQPAPSSLVVRGGHAYWVNLLDATIMSTSIAGGAPAVALAKFAPHRPLELVVDDDHAYVHTDLGVIYRVRLVDGAAEKIAVDVDVTSRMVLDDENVYFGSAGDRAVYAVPRLGAVVEPRLVASEQWGLANLIIDRDMLYVVNETAGTLAAIAKHGGAVTILVNQQFRPVDLARAGRDIVWINEGNSAIMVLRSPPALQAAPVTPGGLQIEVSPPRLHPAVIPPSGDFTFNQPDVIDHQVIRVGPLLEAVVGPVGSTTYVRGGPPVLIPIAIGDYALDGE